MSVDDLGYNFESGESGSFSGSGAKAHKYLSTNARRRIEDKLDDLRLEKDIQEFDFDFDDDE